MHSIPDPSRVRFTGPLAPYAPGLVDELKALGYATTSATATLGLAAHLSRWLEAEGVGTNGLTSEVICRFLQERRRSYTSHYSTRALGPILGYLRRVGAAPEALPASAASVADVLLDRFGRNLSGQRALTAPVIQAYRHWVRPFTEAVLCPGDVDRVRDLSGSDVSRFLAARLPGMSRKSAQMTACALRSLLRFLHAEGLVSVYLVDAVPTVPSWKLSGVPRALAVDDVQALLGACDQSGPVGKRDLAVITMLYRLGLRCAEAAALRLEDVDWPAGTVTVRGKGGRVDRLPLPADVGRVLVDYLRLGRPSTSARALFVRAVAPFDALHASSLSCIVGRAARRAGLGTVHGHRLRHTAATETLNAGATLEEVAQLMRHETVATTVVYAKTDRNRLAQLARPWPTAGGAR